ncbi:MAG: serine hydrolase domain-containing protein [Solirubrobacterales bacterium]
MAKYSNFGVALLGHALGVAAGGAYAELLAERILRPLGLEDTAVVTLDEDDPRAARGHDPLGFAVRRWDLAAIAPAGGIVSTAADMRRWLSAQLHPDSAAFAEAIRMAHEPRVPLHVSALGRVLGAGLAGSRVGLAWITTEVGERAVTWHNGGTGGFGSFVGFDPEAGCGIVVLTNSTHTGRLDAAGMSVLSSE